MQKAEPQHNQAQNQTAAAQRKGASIESPQGEQLAQLEAMAETSPQADRLAQLAAMANAGPQAAAQRRTMGMIHDGPRMAAQRRAVDAIHSGSPDAATRVEAEAPLQAKVAQREEAPAKRNDTGLPDNLKSGIENLSGMSMDNVRVHYNSSQPAQLNAHAYAQGTDIHVAPGQEQHLPHEAWHVVQQAQGRVQPTMQMKGDVPVNDNAGLEREADVMGQKAFSGGVVMGRSIASDPIDSFKSLESPLQFVKKRKRDETPSSSDAFIKLKEKNEPALLLSREIQMLDNVVKEKKLKNEDTKADEEQIKMKRSALEKAYSEMREYAKTNLSATTKSEKEEMIEWGTFTTKDTWHNVVAVEDSTKVNLRGIPHTGHYQVLIDANIGDFFTINLRDDDRPVKQLGKEAKAQVTGGTLSPTGARNATPKGYAALGQNEVQIATGIDPAHQTGSYDAGHLIGDQLIGGVTDSMVDGNFGVQNKKFNEVPYLSLFEKPVSKAAENGTDVEIAVDLDYGTPFTRTVRALESAGVVTRKPEADDEMLEKKREAELTFTRAIPKTWVARAVTKKGEHPKQPSPNDAKKSYTYSKHGAPSKDATKSTEVTAMGSFSFTLNTAVPVNVTQPTSGTRRKRGTSASSKPPRKAKTTHTAYTMETEQWQPPEKVKSSITREEVIDAVRRLYPFVHVSDISAMLKAPPPPSESERMEDD